MIVIWKEEERSMAEKKILVTGFEPFGGETINPAWEAVRILPETIGDYRVERMQVPTVFQKAYELAVARAEELDADAILCVGQAGGRDAVTPERVGINLRDASIPDNAGNQPSEQPIAADGPAAYFSTLPVARMAKAIRDASLPGRVSNTAGTFVCNDLLYSLLHHFADRALPVGFVHVPYLPEQAKNGQPSLALEDIAKALTAAIEAM